MLELENVEKYIGDKLIFKNVNIKIEKGETYAIIGPSGSGKSTLLRTMIGLVKPTKGSIKIFGEDITDLKEEKLNKIRRKMSMSFQEGALFDSLSVYENVAFPLRYNTTLKENQIKEIVKEKLQLVKMEGTEHLFPSQLSGGMQRRIGLARALALSPEIILYDEPTTGLDPIIANTISDLILELKNKLNVTSVIVTHDIDTVFKVATRVGMLYQNTLVDIGTPDEVKNSKEEFVYNFIKGKVQ